MIYKLKSEFRDKPIALADGRSMFLNRALVSPKRQRFPWSTEIQVRGSLTARVSGTSARGVFAKARHTLSLNDVEVDDEDIWLNLNLAWIQLAKPEERLISAVELLKMAETVDKTEEPFPTTEKRSFSVEMWGRFTWESWNFYLARQDYNAVEFQRILRDALNILSPAKNPFLGCSKCHIHWADTLSKSDPNRDYPDRESARKWLVNIHNQVNVRLGKPKMSFKDVAEKYFWN